MFYLHFLNMVLFYFSFILKNGANAKVLLKSTGTHKIKAGDILLHFITGLTARIGCRFTTVYTTQYNQFYTAKF